jgi:hypothetical protein
LGSKGLPLASISSKPASARTDLSWLEIMTMPAWSDLAAESAGGCGQGHFKGVHHGQQLDQQILVGEGNGSWRSRAARFL